MRTGHCVSNQSQNIEAQGTHCSVYALRNGCVDTHPWPTRYSLLLHISLHKDLSQSLVRGVEREAGKKKKMEHSLHSGPCHQDLDCYWYTNVSAYRIVCSLYRAKRVCLVTKYYTPQAPSTIKKALHLFLIITKCLLLRVLRLPRLLGLLPLRSLLHLVA